MSPLINTVDLIVALCLATVLSTLRPHSAFVGAAPISDANGGKVNASDQAVPTEAAAGAAAAAAASSPMTKQTMMTGATTISSKPAEVAAEAASSTVASAVNGTIPAGFGVDVLQNRGMIVRMTYVLVGFSILILLYFIVKAVRLRRVNSRTRKYGVLTENLDSPLGLGDESDEEVEVFEVNGSNMRGGRTPKNGTTPADRLLP